MTFTEAAALVLRLVGKPLHYKEITDVAIEKNLLSHVGKSPEVTMGARLNALAKKGDKENPLVRLKPGVFALREWDNKRIEEGLLDRTPAIQKVDDEELSKLVQSENLQIGQEGPLAAHAEVDDDSTPPDEEEKHRAELSAMATDLFAPEDDDDKPIFGAEEELEPKTDAAASTSDGDGDRREGRRRRRRRRSRGRRDEEGARADGDDDDLPTYTVSDVAPEVVFQARHTEEEPAIVVGSEHAEERSSDASLDLADMIEKALLSFDRSRGPVSLSNLADALRRRLRSEGGLGPGVLLGIIEADNLRAEGRGRMPRFRLSGNRVAPTSWGFERRSEDRQRALVRAMEQLRESTVKALGEQLSQLSHRALGDLVLVLLDRMGVRGLCPVKRPGAHGSELHWSGQMGLLGLDAASSALASQRTAIIVRRDGRDLGRERVTELRGALHHYGPASQGVLITTGQVLSGAREEAASASQSPVHLLGRAELSELCFTFGVGVKPMNLDVKTLDFDLFDQLTGRS